MQADRAYNGSARYVKHQKLDPSASLFFLLTRQNGEILTSCDRTNPGQFLKSFSSYGLYGNALATGIDAPPRPKVSSIRIPLICGGTGNAPKTVPMSVEPCNLAGKRGGVKGFVWPSFQPGFKGIGAI